MALFCQGTDTVMKKRQDQRTGHYGMVFGADFVSVVGAMYFLHWWPGAEHLTSADFRVIPF